MSLPEDVIPDMMCFLAIKDNVCLKSTCRSMLIHAYRRYIAFLLDNASKLLMPKPRRWNLRIRNYTRLHKEMAFMICGQLYVLEFIQRLLGAIINNMLRETVSWKKKGNKKQRLLSNCDSEAFAKTSIWRTNVGSEVIRTLNILENKNWFCSDYIEETRRIINHVNRIITFVPREFTPDLRKTRRVLSEHHQFRRSFIRDMNEYSYKLRGIVKEYLHVMEVHKSTSGQPRTVF